ncbi:MAG: polysaccharide pyruvyl transferase family protein [Lachnospiraceae bacterium]|nr:polysaccharide pyruvyl transferase family protein [Lachnospiraceae bacterium]
MRVGILTYHRSINYGAYIQALFLQREIAALTGHEVEIIDYDSASSRKHFRKDLLLGSTGRKIHNIRRHLMFRRMQKKLPISKESLVTDDVSLFREFIGDRYDLVIVGSDEVWNIGGLRPFPNPYWLPDTGCRKAAYAASGRNDIGDLDAGTKDAIKKYLGDFEFISVRDSVTGDMIDTLLPERSKASIVCDPVMAYDISFDHEEGRRLLREKFGTEPDKKVIAVMDSTGEIVGNLDRDESVQFISLYSYYKGFRNDPDVTPEEWMQIIAASDGLITAFFHGMCIALKSNTPFLYVEERDVKENRYSKGYDLMNRNGITDRYVYHADSGIKNRIDEFVNKAVSECDEAAFDEIVKNERSRFESFKNYITDI